MCYLAAKAASSQTAGIAAAVVLLPTLGIFGRLLPCFRVVDVQVQVQVEMQEQRWVLQKIC